MTPVATPTQAAPQVADPTKMAFDEVIDRLIDAGLTPEAAASLYELFEQLTPLVAAYDKTGTQHVCCVDVEDAVADSWDNPDMPYIAALTMTSTDPRHAALEQIMPDLQTAAPGSAHEALNRGLLKDGDSFMHDRIGHCVIAVKRG